MNWEGYQEMKAMVSELGCEVVPELKRDQHVQFFDVVSEGGSINPSTVLNTIHDSALGRTSRVEPELIAAQPHCLTFEDKAN